MIRRFGLIKGAIWSIVTLAWSAAFGWAFFGKVGALEKGGEGEEMIVSVEE